MKKQILATMAAHLDAKIALHTMNIEILLENPNSIPEHTGFMESLEIELEALSGWLDKRAALDHIS